MKVIIISLMIGFSFAIDNVNVGETIQATKINEVINQVNSESIIKPKVFAYDGPYHSATGIQTIEFTTVDINDGNGWNTSNSEFTAPIAGYYKVDASWITGDKVTNNRYALYKEGVRYGSNLFSSALTANTQGGSWIILLNQNERIKLRVDVNSTGAVSIHPNYRSLTIEYLD